MSITRKQSWRAIRRAAIYCAPACGGGCTWKAYQAAKRNGKALAERLSKTSGVKGWTVRVWENLGWHWSAISPCGRMKVHEHRGSLLGRRTHHYTAFLGEKGCAGGRWAESGNTPKQAVNNCLRAARADLASLGAKLNGWPE